MRLRSLCSKCTRNYNDNIYTGLRSDPDETGLLQLGTLRRASQQHQEVASCAKQCSQNRPPGTEAVPCQTADASTTLDAGSTQNDHKVSVLTCKTLNTSVPLYLRQTHQPRQRTETTLDGYATARPTVRSHRLRETFFFRCAAPSVWTHFLRLSSETIHCLYSNLC